MATKAEVKAFLRANYSLEEVETDFYKFVFTNSDNQRSQLLFASVDDVKLIVSSPFAPADKITSDKALEVSHDYVFGIKKFSSWYMFQTAIWVENLDPNEITDTLGAIAASADEVEDELGLGDNL
jgi:hypothetical protein